MARIKVTPDQVSQCAGQFRTASSESQQLVSRLQSTMDGLQPEWEGMTSLRFYQDYSQWRQSMTQFVELLNSIGQQLDSVAERFRAADQG